MSDGVFRGTFAVGYPDKLSGIWNKRCALFDKIHPHRKEETTVNENFGLLELLLGIEVSMP